jgi:hypothetical protein
LGTAAGESSTVAVVGSLNWDAYSPNVDLRALTIGLYKLEVEVDGEMGLLVGIVACGSYVGLV